MDIYDYAMQMEKDGETFYREVAGKTSNAGIRNILLRLAEAEVRHYKIFEAMKRDEKAQASDAAILSDVKNIFLEMREGRTFNVDVSQTELYRRAQEIEKKTRDFYMEKADEVEDASRKKVFLEVADEEKKHYAILENIINFVSQPETWLENPEWYHPEDS